MYGTSVFYDTTYTLGFVVTSTSYNCIIGPFVVKIYIGNPHHSTRFVETRLMIELDFNYLFFMELRSFEKHYVALLNSSNWATGGPLRYDN